MNPDFQSRPDAELTPEQVSMYSPWAMAMALEALADPIRGGDSPPKTLKVAFRDAAAFVDEARSAAPAGAREVAGRILRAFTIDGDTPLFAVGSEDGEPVVRSLYAGDIQALVLALWLGMAVTSVQSRACLHVDSRNLPEDIRHLSKEMANILSGLGVKAEPFVFH